MVRFGRKVFSGEETVKILVKHFGFETVKTKGSHVKCRKEVGGRRITTIVPQHKELAPGTFLSALDLAEVTKEEFLIIANKKRK